ncbi:MAG: hypothetical protein QCI82_07640 [Candidatus Thermoplasmatota archaeon]|nr:hypothetical protein [Candidatus Thermoplasmatota archaeon]
MYARSRSRHSSETSKTDRIAGLFTSQPFRVFTPKELSVELGMKLQLVTTIVNRLKDEGLIERVGWGKYRLRTDASFDRETVEGVMRDFLHLSSEVLGSDIDATGIEGDDMITPLIDTYERIKDLAGESFSANILRICVNKRMEGDQARVFIRLVAGVMG